MRKANRFGASNLGSAPAGMAEALLRASSIAELRDLSPMPDDAQKLIDDAVIGVALERLVVFADVMAAGLVFPISEPLSVLDVQWEQISKSGGAQRTMNPGARGESQLVDRSIKNIPIYVTADDFSLNVRSVLASARNGTPLDLTMVEQATRRVNEALEDAIINGADVQVGSNTTPGILGAPNVNTQAYVDNEAWTVVGHSGDDILADVLNMFDQLQTDKMYGPYNLYIPTTYGNKINQDFKANSDKTIRMRLEELEAGGRNLIVRVADQLPTDRTILMQMTSDVIDIIDGEQPTVVPFTSLDGFTLYWIVMAIMVPRVKDDYTGQSGICTGNLT